MTKWLTGMAVMAGMVTAGVLVWKNMDQGAKRRVKKYAGKMAEEVEDGAMDLCPWCKD